MRVRARFLIPCVEEQNRVTFEHMLNAVVVVRLVHRDDMSNDAVTSVSRLERITIDTCLVNRLTLEQVVVAFAHRMTDGVECRSINHKFHSVEVAFAVH